MNKIGNNPSNVIAALEAANREKDGLITHVVERAVKRETELLNEIRYLKSVILKGRE